MDRNIDSLELSIRRQKRFEKISLVKIEMEANIERKVGDEVITKRLHIVYFLSRKGKIEQPHLITVDHHLNNNGVHLRDFKRWLSELRGKEMPESFTWSYKRKYKAGYIWQDLTDDNLIIPTSSGEYVLKGSTIKIFEKIKEETKTLRTSGETLQREKTTSSKPPEELEEQSPVETSNLSSEEAQRKTEVFKIDSWKEEMKRAEKLSCEEIVPMENERKLTEVKVMENRDNKVRRWVPFVLRDFLSCRTVGTKDSIMRAVSNQNQSGSRRNNRSST